MPITVPPFTTSAVINGTTKVAQADEQLQIFMNETTAYVQSSYSTVANQLINDVSTYTANATAQATNAAASATAAASSATSASASKTAAATSETNALASKNAAATSATNAATSASTATTQATNAASSATNANTSAINAAASATASSNSATAAATSATNAASTLTAINLVFDNFDDRFLGAKATDPTLDNDGNAILVGAIYYNTTTKVVKFYNGTAWEAPSVSATASATAAATSEANALASKNAAATSETNALASKNAAATSATNAATSETNALASKNAAATSATNAATSETNALASKNAAATSATNAASSATAASTSATNATSSATAASTSATTATTQATNAASSATSALSSKNAAATSEANAATSATNAATSEATTLSYKNAMELLFDTFDDRFLGVKASDPTVDNDGNPLVIGTIYYNSTTKAVKFYNGVTWDAPSVSATASATAASNSATAAATSATNAATSETNALAYKNAAVTSATNASTSETNALASKNAAVTSATNAASSATSAAGSATTATTQASTATTQATNASASATAAATSATNAASSATSAAGNKTAMDTALVSFGGMYVGAFDTAPLTGAFGSVLKAGSLYFNTTDNTMKMYTGSTWITPAIDSSNLYTKSDIQTILPKVGFDTANIIAPGLGQMAWNSTENTVDIGLNGATLQVGQEQLIRVKNTTGSTITNGKAVMATGTTGNAGRINVAPANITSANARYFLGIVTEDIAAGAEGFCTTFGKIRAIQTNGGNYGETWADGDVLYVKDSSAGLLTNIVPTDSQVKLPVAIVINSHASNGTIFVRATVTDENHANSLINSKFNLSNVAMSKAQFNALADERKASRAGSGFEEWGKHHITVATYPNVNEGIWTPTITEYTNKFSIGFPIGNSNSSGISKTEYPVMNINGVVSKVQYLNSTTDSRNYIQLPVAPTIYPSTATLTAEQIASGVIKHADSSNSGLIVNGKFDTDISGWTVYNSGTIVFSANKALITSGGTNYGGASQSLSGLYIGKKYILTFEVSSSIGNRAITITNSDKSSVIQGSTNGVFTIEFIPTSSSCSIIFQGATSTTFSGLFDNIAVYPADAISRSDLVFLESWHEDISEKNFVYPLGNVQYLGSDTDGLTGIANGAFTGFETYSLFGNWQASSALIGKGYVWSSLTEAQKKQFLSNKDNNCYLDGDKVIQVRYRVRVVQGLGDSWASTDASTGNALGYTLGTAGVLSLVQAKGKQSSIIEYCAPLIVGNVILRSDYPNGNYGQYYATEVLTGAPTYTPSTKTAYEGKCFALPIALVHRRNQGAYHPVYNPNGTMTFIYDTNLDGLVDGSTVWYSRGTYQSKVVSSISDTFGDKIVWNSTYTSGKAYRWNDSGYIGAAQGSGRPDGLFYDQVHESDILDLRNSSKKVEDYNRLISREFNKLVVGTYRGKEGEWNELSSGDYTTTGNSYLSRLGASSTRIDYTGNPASLLTNSTLFADAGRIGTYIKGSNGNYYRVIEINISSSNNMAVYLGHEYGDVRSVFPVGTYNLVISDKTTRTKSNTLLHCDIIGNPTNYPTAWKQNGVFGTPLIVAEDGTSLLPTGSKSTFKLSRKANATPLLCLRSTDSGATWTSFTPTFSTTTNEITLTNEPAANLVMVYYQTHTSMAVPAVNSEILEIGDVFATNGTYSSQGSVLANTLIGKTPISIVAPVSMYKGKPMGYKFYNSPIDKLDIVAGYEPIHPTVSGFGTTVSPTIKVFPYLTRTNGKAYLNLVFKEMKYNGTTWGDHDNMFNIVDNVSTTTDGNGQTILIGQKTVELPYFIGADE